MAGIPIVVVASKGLPVTLASNGRGAPMTIATNGYGIPVTVVASGGMPVTGFTTGPDITAPIITSSNTISQPENTALVHFLSANEAVTWAKVGGADAAAFTLGSGATAGQLSLPAKDWETQARTWVVQVQATDLAANPSAIQTITVTITDVAEGTLTFTLTDIASGRLFQRTKALTTGPVSASGTYTGTVPTVEMQVLKVSDNSVVKDWTTGTGTVASGNWAVTITGVPQGGSYYVKARPVADTGLVKVGSNPFFVGMLYLCYGQSNMGTFIGASSSPASQGATTTWFARASAAPANVWTTVPTGNGIRNFLNNVASVAGIPCAGVAGDVAASAIGNLSKGQGLYENFLTDIILAGGDAEAILWMQGEGDAPISTTEAQYKTALSQLHTDLCADLGRTKAQLPLYTCSLGPFTGTSNPTGYEKINIALVNAGVEQAPNLIWSHTKIDATNTDTQHQDAPSNGKVGLRFARTVTNKMGVTATAVPWLITGSATVDATHTDVTLTHSLGTDFTPTSAIDGFEVSGDNGGSWAATTAAVRISATKISLTHASLATDSSRKLRYLYGDNPTRANLVLDNSSLNVPLSPSYGVLSPTPLSVSAIPTWRAGVLQPYTTTIHVSAGISIGAAAARRMIIITGAGVHATATNLTSVVVTPNVGTAKTMTKILTTGSNPGMAMHTCILDADADTATTISITSNYGTDPGNSSKINVWTIPSGDLTSTTATGTLQASGTGTTTVGSTLVTSAGGFIIAGGHTNTGSGTATAVISDTGSVETFTERYDNNTNFEAVAADASNTTASASRNVTVTFSVSGNPRIVAAAWR